MLYNIVQEEETVQPNKTCQLLGIPANTYKYWKNHAKQQPDNKGLLHEIKHIAKEFPRYGYRRIAKALPLAMRTNHKKVLRIMKENGLLCKKRKAFKPTTTNSNHSFTIHPNRVKSFHATSLNQIWFADITYIGLAKGFAYLAVILDAFSRKCLGWKISRSIDSQLAQDALIMAIDNRQGMSLGGLIHHSDRGTQYACHEYVALLEQQGIAVSMSAKGNPYDNAFAESFIKTIKYDEVYLNEYETFEDAQENIENFIEKIYNEKRLHSAIGYLPPAEFEQKILKEVSA